MTLQLVSNELQLTSTSEPRGKFREFYGCPLEKMPELNQGGYKPLSLSGMIKRRLHAPRDVLEAWRENYVFTSDAAVYDGKGNAKIALDSILLRSINTQSEVSEHPPEGGLLLSSDQWEGLDGDNVLPLSSTEIERANDGGFVYKRGSWRPVNSTVRKIWHFLGRGMDLKEYAELVHTATGRAEVMNVVFYRNIDSSPLLRPWLLGRVRDNSLAVGLGNLAYNRGRLVGRRPEKRVSLVQKVPSYAEKESVYRMLLQ
ncbi:hypothetical protein HYV87_00945 [Candidatus Woesearchaeota archaeon]|nr:hypothetical protein [Candidatus Woesearchaeota archaeon]